MKKTLIVLLLFFSIMPFLDIYASGGITNYSVTNTSEDINISLGQVDVDITFKITLENSLLDGYIDYNIGDLQSGSLVPIGTNIIDSTYIEYTYTVNYEGATLSNHDFKIAYYKDTGVTTLTSVGTLTTTDIQKFAVRFYDKDENLIERQDILPGEDATPPTAPSVPGYTFSHWSQDYTNVSGNVWTYAQYDYTPTLNEYTVTFNDYNDVLLNTETVTEGYSSLYVVEPTRTGYIFTGWSCDSDKNNVQNDITCTAEYVEETASKYTVIFKDYYGTTLSTQELWSGESATPPTPGIVENYVFNDWLCGSGDYANVTQNMTCNADYSYNDPTYTPSSIYPYDLIDTATGLEMDYYQMTSWVLEQHNRIGFPTLSNPQDYYWIIGGDGTNNWWAVGINRAKMDNIATQYPTYIPVWEREGNCNTTCKWALDFGTYNSTYNSYDPVPSPWSGSTNYGAQTTEIGLGNPEDIISIYGTNMNNSSSWGVYSSDSYSIKNQTSKPDINQYTWSSMTNTTYYSDFITVTMSNGRKVHHYDKEPTGLPGYGDTEPPTKTYNKYYDEDETTLLGQLELDDQGQPIGTTPTPLEKDGKYFIGYTVFGTDINGNYLLKANYGDTIQEYQITFAYYDVDPETGETALKIYSTQTVTTCQAVIYPTNEPSIPGYQFVEWKLETPSFASDTCVKENQYYIAITYKDYIAPGGEINEDYNSGFKAGQYFGFNPLVDLFNGLMGSLLMFIFTIGGIDLMGVKVMAIIYISIIAFIIGLWLKFKN